MQIKSSIQRSAQLSATYTDVYFAMAATGTDISPQARQPASGEWLTINEWFPRLLRVAKNVINHTAREFWAFRTLADFSVKFSRVSGHATEIALHWLYST